MKILKRTTLLFIITSFLLVFFSGFCFADRELELVYPELGIPDVKTPTVTTTILTDFVKYVFTLSISIAGLLAFGALIYGGFRYITSAGDPTKMSDGKDQAMAGFLGLIILLSSYLILNTIDPRFVMTETPNLASLEQGIYAYVKTGCVDDPEDSFDDPVIIVQSSPDLSTVLPTNANGNPQSLQCIKFRSPKEELTVWAYSDKATKSDGGWFFTGTPTKYEGNSGETVNVAGQPEAIKLDYYLPGVYLFAEENCTGESNLYQNSSATLPEFDNKAQSIMFIYGDKNDISGEYETKYAAILHQNENFMGKAALFDQDQNICLNLSAAERVLNNPNKYYSSNPIGISSCKAATCTDTDGGQNWNTYGECDENGDGVTEGKDFCFNVSTLWEEYCDGSECKMIGYTCPVGEYCWDGACHTESPPLRCEDTDGGKDYDTLGSCYDINGSTVWKGSDECKSGSSTVLTEWYCDSSTSRCKTEELDCNPNGCSSGTCTTSPPTCTDDDGGKNYTIKGTCTGGGYPGTDSCTDSTFLKEYYCEGSTCKYMDRSCSPGNCVNGVCTEVPRCMYPSCEGAESDSCMCGTTEIQNQYCCASINGGYNQISDCSAACGGGGGGGGADGGYGSNLSGGVSSITVYLKPIIEPTGEGVQFFGDKNYTHEKEDFVLPEGENVYFRDGDTMSDLGDADNKITSMQMKGPYVALLFDGTNYSGECEVFMSSCPDFRSYRIGQCGFLGRGDCLSSFVIKARK